MAKAGKKKHEKAAGSGASADDPLADGIETFAHGDYARAKLILTAKASDPTLSESEREQARELVAATGLERGTLWVGLACIGLLMLVILVTKLTQP